MLLAMVGDLLLGVGDGLERKALVILVVVPFVLVDVIANRLTMPVDLAFR